MKVTVVIEDSGSGVQITGAGPTGSSAFGSQGGITVPSPESGGAFDGGAGPVIAGSPGSAAAPEPFMPTGPEGSSAPAGSSADIAAGPAPGASALPSAEGDAVPGAAARGRARGQRSRKTRR